MSTAASGAAATHKDVTAIVVGILADIAPEVDASSIDPAADMRYELEIDSIDFLNLMIGIDERLGIDVPEADYGDVTTLDELVAYLVEHGAEDSL